MTKDSAAPLCERCKGTGLFRLRTQCGNLTVECTACPAPPQEAVMPTEGALTGVRLHQAAYATRGEAEPVAWEVERLTKCLATANANHEKFERLWYLAKDDLDRLKLAICGGEDVPGAINAVSVEDCVGFIAEERSRHDYLASQPHAPDSWRPDREEALDAARFRALMRCGRIKMQGSSGVDPHTGERNGNNVHFGAEFWPEPIEPEWEDTYRAGTTWGRACIKALADAILEQEALQPKGEERPAQPKDAPNAG